MVFLDLFGGSGLLSHHLKCRYPNNRVVWNDFDNYAERLKPERIKILQEIQAFANAVSKDLENSLNNRHFITSNAQNELKNAIITNKNKAKVMNDLDIFRSDNGFDYAKMGEISILPNKVSYDEFVKKIKTHPNANTTNSAITFIFKRQRAT